MLARFILFGVFGCFGEILWTSVSDPILSIIQRTQIDKRLRGVTYLWMFPIYGFGGLFFEQLYGHVADLSWPLRGLVYTAMFFVGEYLWGLAIKLLTGQIPWDYSYTRFHVHGLIRLDYAPVWFTCGLVTEWVMAIIAAGAPVMVEAALQF